MTLRFIIRRHVGDAHEKLDTTTYYTVDADVPELEAMLKHGGHGSACHDLSELVGVEFLPPTPEAPASTTKEGA